MWKASLLCVSLGEIWAFCWNQSKASSVLSRIKLRPTYSRNASYNAAVASCRFVSPVVTLARLTFDPSRRSFGSWGLVVYPSPLIERVALCF